MSDYLSKHKGKTIDSDIDVIENLNPKKNGFVAKNSNKEYVVVPVSSSSFFSGSGAIYMDNGTLKRGTLDDDYISNDVMKKVSNPSKVIDITSYFTFPKNIPCGSSKKAVKSGTNIDRTIKATV